MTQLTEREGCWVEGEDEIAYNSPGFHCSSSTLALLYTELISTDVENYLHDKLILASFCECF